MIPLKFKIDRKSLQTMYFAFVMPVMEYANVVWGGSYDSDINKLERIHIAAMRLVTGATSHSNIQRLYTETAWISVRSRIELSMLTVPYKIKHLLVLTYLCQLMPQLNNAYIQYHLRNIEDIRLPYSRLEVFKRSFFPAAIRLWNRLGLDVQNAPTLSLFKKAIKADFPEANILYFYGKRWRLYIILALGCNAVC